MKKEEIKNFVFERTVGGDLDYVQFLLHEYSFSQNVIERAHLLINQIKNRLDDPNFYLGVVGEFSSGKSTLINALLKDDLLKEDIIEGTTTAATFLMYGEPMDVDILMRDGEVLSYRKDGINFWSRFTGWFALPSHKTEKKRLRDFIKKITTSDELADSIAKVSVRHHGEILNQGLVIIDTPGANSNNQKHKEIAAEMIREHCDTVIFTTPAESPVSQTQLDFIKCYLHDMLDHCVFFVTMIDKIRERERPRLLEEIRRRLEKGLETKRLNILVAAPGVYMDVLRKEEKNLPHSKEKIEAYVIEFLSVRDMLWNKLLNQRQVTIQDRLSILLLRLIEELPKELQQQKRDFQSKHKALLRNQIPNLSDFIYQRKTEYTSSLRTEVSKLNANFLGEVNNIYKNVLSRVKDCIYNCENTTQISERLDGVVNQELQKAQKSLEKAQRRVVSKAKESANKQVNRFEEEFSSFYKSLATLGGMIRQDDIASGMVFSAEIDTNNALVSLQKHNEAESISAFGGGGVGALIGTFLLPGIGTVLGGVVGAFLGGFFGPSLEQTKNETWSKIRSSLTSNFSSIETTLQRSVEQFCEKLADSLADTIENYFSVYAKLVAEMIEKDRLEAEKIKMQEKNIQEELEKLEDCRNRLERQRDKLRELSNWKETNG